MGVNPYPAQPCVCFSVPTGLRGSGTLSCFIQQEIIIYGPLQQLHHCHHMCAFAASANSPTSQAGWCSRAGSGRGAELVLVTERAKLLKDSRYYRWPQRSTSHFSHSPCGAFAESRRLVPEHLDLFPSDRGTQDWIATRMGIAWKCGNCTPFTWPRSAFKMLNMSVGGG